MAYQTNIPPNCRLLDEWETCSYRDCFAEDYWAKPNETAIILFTWTLVQQPWWVRSLMSVRNFVVRFFGLKTDTPNPSFSERSVVEYQPGDHIGFFLIEHIADNELVVSTNDRHLDASFSFQISDSREVVSLTSTVTTKERFGRIYIFVIAPFHKAIIRYMLRRLNPV